MSNIYDIFRGVQAKKTSCYDERSAAFISEGLVSQDVTHVRLNKTIKAAVTFNDKEGPDESIVYTFNSDNLLKGDYYIYNSNYYLVYEDVKLTDDSLTWKKQKSLECNITFTFNNSTVRGYFISGLRQKQKETLEKNNIIVPDEQSLLIIPSTISITNNELLTFGGKVWSVMDFDKISNNGINYIVLERNTASVTSVDEPFDTDLNTESQEETDILYAMVEYKFETNDAYFISSPEVEIISRKSSEVIIKVPFGISSVTITTKNITGDLVAKTYEVVE